MQSNLENMFSHENQKHSCTDWQPLGSLRLISQKSNPKIIMLKYFSISFVTEVTDFSLLGIFRWKLPDMLLKPWRREEVIGQCSPPSLRVIEQVRNINSSSSCGPLLCTCGPGYELAQARPLSTLFANVNTLLTEKEKRENTVQTNPVFFVCCKNLILALHVGFLISGRYNANPYYKIFIMVVTVPFQLYTGCTWTWKYLA